MSSLTKKDNQKVQKQYKKWVYPEPISDLKAWIKSGAFQAGDPSYLFHHYWPHREKKPIRILIAGCGTSQAAAYAFTNRDCEVVGIDFSKSSLKHSRHLKKKHNLTNLTLREMSIYDIAQLDRKFDIVVSTGVLHHLPDPVAGGKALTEVLAPDGVMSLMVYGSTRRAGVYMLQAAFRAAGLDQSQSDVNLMKMMMKSLPKDHAIHRYNGAAADLQYDAGLVDTFLHPQDRAYTVPEVYAFADEIGLKFRDWVDPGEYALENFILPNFPGYERLQALSTRDQAIFIDNFFQTRGKHSFVLCHHDATGYEISFEGDEWLSYVPIVPFTLILEKAPNFSMGQRSQWRRLGYSFVLGPYEHALLTVMDSKKTAAECVKAAVALMDKPPELSVEIAKAMLALMWKRGHLLFRTTKSQ